jgi:hypothetical protein
VLPANTDQEAERWAIGWNGLLYPIASLGTHVDLASDVREMIRRSLEEPDHYKSVFGVGKIGSTTVIRNRDYEHRGISEQTSLSPYRLTPLRVFLVFRFGATQIAEDMWKEYYRDCDNSQEDPFLNIAVEWLWGIWDRAICAHLRGDDRIALFTLRQLLPLARICEAGWQGCRLPNYRYGEDGFRNPKFFFFAKDCAILLQDQERRLWEQTAGGTVKANFGWNPFEAASLTNLISSEARAIELIRSLDQVGITQDGQPGGLDLDSSSAVRDLIKLGDDAVEPLINCLEFDTRLTRTVYFGRDFHPDRDFLEVAALGQYALSRILKTNAMVARSKERPTRVEYAKAVRAFRQRFRGVSVAERCFQILADDTAGFEQWAESAANLTRENDEELSPKEFGWKTMPEPRKGPPPPLVGEPFRTRKNPSLSDLFEKRCRTLMAAKRDYREDSNTAGRADRPLLTLVTAWGKWDPDRIVFLMQEFLSEKLGLDPGSMYTEGSLPSRVSTMMFGLGPIARKAGHEEVMDWIASYISANPQETSWTYCVARFFSTEHDSPAAQRFLQTAIEDKTSPWGTAFRRNIIGESQWWSQLSEQIVRIVAPMIPMFREILTDNRPFGTAEMGWSPESFGETTIALRPGITYTARFRGTDYFWPKYKDVIGFSIGDWFCQWFGDFTKTARFRVFWPKPVKDFARKRCIDLWFGGD